MALITTKSGNAAHDAVVSAAETAREAALKAIVSSMAKGAAAVQQIKAADAAEYFAIVTSAQSNGISPNTISQHVLALRDIGLTPDKLPQGYGSSWYVSKGWPA